MNFLRVSVCVCVCVCVRVRVNHLLRAMLVDEVKAALWIVPGNVSQIEGERP